MAALSKYDLPFLFWRLNFDTMGKIPVTLIQYNSDAELSFKNVAVVSIQRCPKN